MKKIMTILSLICSLVAIGQSDTLDANQVWANVNANGCFFTSPTVNRAGYEVPKDNGVGPDVIYNSAFWVGAKDQNDSVRVSANLFIGDQKDFKTGPVALVYTGQSFIDKYDHVYSITSAEIQTHQQNWNNPNYTMPADILNWPGNGDVTNGEAAILAPFVDYNANDLYEPQLGDHPVIRGDHAQYFILNDHDGDHPLSGGENLNMEYHFMVYQYRRNGFLDSTTFINLKIVNRSQEVYDQLIVGNYTDFDIGGALDDLAGTSSEKNMVFAYNGDFIDDAVSGGAPLFGDNPPACGIKLLNHNMGAGGTFNNAGGIQGDPQSELQFWGYMNAEWGASGLPFTEGGNGFMGAVPTNFLYDGNPNDTSLWTEVSVGNPPDDRRAFMSSQPVDNFAPGDYICYDFAVLYSRTGGNAYLNVNGLFDVADSAQAFYDNQSFYYCEPVLLSTNDFTVDPKTATLFPNPAKNQFSIQLAGNFDLEIYDIAGKQVMVQTGVNENQAIPAPRNAGIYIVKIVQNGISSTKKLIVE